MSMVNNIFYVGQLVINSAFGEVELRLNFGTPFPSVCRLLVLHMLNTHMPISGIVVKA